MVVDTLYRNVKVRGQLWEIDSLSLSTTWGPGIELRLSSIFT